MQTEKTPIISKDKDELKAALEAIYLYRVKQYLIFA